MTREVYFLPSEGSGVRHRFETLSNVKAFADHFAYRVYFLWGVSNGVAFCRFEELFLPIPGVTVINVFCEQARKFQYAIKHNLVIRYNGRILRIFNLGAKPTNMMFVFNLDASALNRLVPSFARPRTPVRAVPVVDVQTEAKKIIAEHLRTAKQEARDIAADEKDDAKGNR